MSAAVEPPRGLVLLAAVWIAISWLVSFGLRMPLQISAGALTPGVRSMLICCALGALVAWPMLRLCQPEPRAPVRATLLDAATVMVLLQTVLWPLRLATTWAPERTALIDMALVGGLLVMVMISGYENFVSQLDIDERKEKLNWLGKMDSGSLKMKVAASIVAISSIHLLKVFMDAKNIPDSKLMWYVILHLTFVASAFAMGYLDKLTKHDH